MAPSALAGSLPGALGVATDWRDEPSIAPVEVARARPTALSVVPALLTLFAVGRVHELFPATSTIPVAKVLLPLALLSLLFSRGIRDRLHALLTLQGAGLALFLVAALLSVPGSLNPGDSASRLWYFTATTALYGVIVATAARSPRELLWLFRAVVVAVIVMAVLVASGAAGSVEGRAFASSTYDPNDLAMVAVVSFPLAMTIVRERSTFWRWVGALGLGAAVLLVVKSASRGGMLGLAVVLVGTLVVYRRSLPRRWKLGLIPLVALALLLAPNVFWQRLASITSIRTDYNLTDPTGRIAIWSRGMGYIANRPVFGLGFEQYRTAETRWLNRTWGYRGWRPTARVAHNMFIQVTAETGVTGLAGFLLMLVPTVRAARRVRRAAADGRLPASAGPAASALLLALLGFAVTGFFLSVAYTAVALFLAGAGMALSAMARRARAARPVPASG